jgi:hypothetical protein
MTPDVLERAITGDMGAFAMVRVQDHAVLIEAEGGKRPLVLTPAAVLRVLRSLQSGHLSPELAQAWASFVSRGYVARRPPAEGPIGPLTIDWDRTAESAMADVLSRMDELGDAIDGTIDNDEAERSLEA